MHKPRTYIQQEVQLANSADCPILKTQQQGAIDAGILRLYAHCRR
jgi:hypothetical protein